ncbi:inorganic diphosphatase [Mucilaginibacter jinjuensis]|uniref:inorganic diphosphatase n=1 Tax=Mucilaginibacter jinjuensis TaxID=1176721 RepID=A0ABY7TDK9_9SPHI|nr:inorganic diphosphatase [Mucilaginibacter jinjuensis]WCT13252.1 inorganic diphosphatase [Mucilaginibacter jinjuensis]
MQAETITVMIESPKGVNQKFDYDDKEGRFRLNKILPAGLAFPFDFGMIPNTRGKDGDPLDIIVIDERGTFPGCLIDCRIIGAFQAEQTERNGKKMRNDRFVGVPDVSQLFSEVNRLDELPEAILNQLEYFFKNYNEQAGKQFQITARLNAEQALKLIEDGTIT